jgi:hypothetical protein
VRKTIVQSRFGSRTLELLLNAGEHLPQKNLAAIEKSMLAMLRACAHVTAVYLTAHNVVQA